MAMATRSASSAVNSYSASSYSSSSHANNASSYAATSGSYAATTGQGLGYYMREYSTSDWTLAPENEKKLFVKLNDRLAKYIEIVRSFKMSEQDIAYLIDRASTVHIGETAIVEIEKRYKFELEEAERERVRLQGDISRWRGKYAEIDREIGIVKEKRSAMVRTAQQEHNSEVVKTIKTMEHKYDGQLVIELERMRAEFNRQLLEISQWCKVQMGGVHLDMSHFNEVVDIEREVVLSRERHDELEARIRIMQKTIDELTGLVNGYDARFEEFKSHTTTASFTQDINALWNTELAQLRVEFQNKLKASISELVGEKIRLSTELNAYHALLTEEERRLHLEYVGVQQVIMPVEETVRSSSGAVVDVVVDEIDMEGRYIVLTNKGHKDFHLAAWMVKAEADGVVRKFKFQSNQVIKPGRTMTIWSPERGGTHNPPESIVMKAIVWPAGKHIRVELLDESEKVKAWREVSL